MKLLRISAFCLSFACAHAAGIFTDQCGTEVFGGPASSVDECFVNGNSLIRSRGGGTGVAGPNFFRNHISPIRFDQQDITAQTTATYTMTTNPSWTIPVADVFVRLDGIVSILEVDGFITLTLVGSMGGGDDLVVSTGQLDRSNCNTFAIGRCAFSILLEGQQKTSTTATETLTLVASGRVRYEVFGSPTYLAVPEPATLWIAGSTLAFLILGRRRR